MSLTERPHLPTFDSLQPYEKAFIAEYFNNGFDAPGAYYKIVYRGEKVGPEEKTALASAASQMLRRDNIKKAINELAGAYAMPLQEALVRLSNIARADISDIVSIVPMKGPNGAPVLDDDGNPREKVELDLVKIVREGKGYLVRELTWTKSGPSVKLHSAYAALIKVLDIHGAFGRQGKGDSDPGSDTSVDEWKEMQHRRREQARSSLAQFEDADIEILDEGDQDAKDDQDDIASED